MAEEIFSATIPDDRLYCPRHEMWVREIGDGEVLIGVTRYGVFLAGRIIAFTAKPNGAVVDIDRGMATVESRKTVLAVHAPISFVLLAGNEAAEEFPDLLNSDPWAKGWMARARPRRWTEEREGLVDADGYRRHLLSVAADVGLG